MSNDPEERFTGRERKTKSPRDLLGSLLLHHYYAICGGQTKNSEAWWKEERSAVSGVVSGEPRNLILVIRLSTRRQPFLVPVLHPPSRITVCILLPESKLRQEKACYSPTISGMYRRILVLIATLAFVLAVRAGDYSNDLFFS